MLQVEVQGNINLELNFLSLDINIVKKVLHFVCTTRAGPTTEGDPYEMKWSDEFGNVNIQNISCPEVISKFFKHSNSVDTHNHL